MGLYAAKQRGKYPVWQSLDHVGFFPGSGIIFVTVTVSESRAMTDVRVLYMLFQGDWSLYVEQLTLDQVKLEVMEVLQVMFPNITVPQPIDIYFPAWVSNKLFRGSYSNWGPSYVPSHSENLKATLSDRLWFAGEATSVRYFGALSVQLPYVVSDAIYPGFLQGAYFEGQSAGSALAACIQGKRSCERPHVKISKNAQPYQRILTSP